ncbi:hypothetical protein CC79DRAFT_1328679 [Sarocladium strictum]
MSESTQDLSRRSRKLAVLIDADNAQAAAAAALLAEVAKYGTATARRAYGDWTGTSLNRWKEHLLQQSIQPIQQFAYTTGKNATDSAMIIDAMDLLYTGKFDGFCIVSSDSDFTRLASRIRESGLVVYGFGERKTPRPFVAACDKFTYTENLVGERPRPVFVSPTRDAPAVQKKVVPNSHASIDASVSELLRLAVRTLENEDGWASLAEVGLLVNKQKPDFDARTYGYNKLSELIIANNLFAYDRRPPGEGKPPLAYIREHNHSATGGGAALDAQMSSF